MTCKAEIKLLPNYVEPVHSNCHRCDPETYVHRAATVLGHVQMMEGLHLLQVYSIHSHLCFAKSGEAHDDFVFVRTDLPPDPARFGGKFIRVAL